MRDYVDAVPTQDTAALECTQLGFVAARRRMAELGSRILPALADRVGNPEGPPHLVAPQELVEKLVSTPVPEHGRNAADVLQQLQNEILAFGAKTGHPRFYGFIPGPALTESWLAEAVAAAENHHAATWKTAPTAIAAENSILRSLAQYAGYPERSGGGFVSGGSVANLTALVAARDSLVPTNALARAVAYVSHETHSSVAKALRIIGVPDERIRMVETDDSFRISPVALGRAIAADRRSGLLPFAVVATAGTTNTGAIDPIDAVADVCADERLWLHVDGAYGASILMSSELRGQLKGIERSDSLSWDAHKLLLQTYGLGIVLVKDRRHLSRSFSATPEYLEDVRGGQDRVNPGDLGIELTRSPRGLRLWFTLHVLGRRGMAERMEWSFLLAEHVERRLRAWPQWEITSAASLGIVTFRFAPPGLTPEEMDAVNSAIASTNLEAGHSAVYTTTVRGKKVLRMATTNPETTVTDVDSTLDQLDQIARDQLNLHARHLARTGGTE